MPSLFVATIARIVTGARLSLTVGAAVVAFTMTATAIAAHEGYAGLVDELRPSVVSISVYKQMQANANRPEFNIPENSPFREYFEQFFNFDREQLQNRQNRSFGSGFLISAAGNIVTNNHVIEKAEKIVVQLYDGREFDAEIVGTDPKTDIALLTIDAGESLPAVEFGDSEQVRVGDQVVAIGNPHGLGFSVSAGIVSARNRSLSGTYDDFLQTDAAITFGNSGGPLFNLDGEVIGVNTAIVSAAGARGGPVGIGFSMASAVVSKVIAQLEEFGTTRRGWMGVVLQVVTSDIADALGLAEPKGAMIANVMEGPAQDAGLLPGDVIVSINGLDVADVRSAVRIVGDTQAGSEVPVTVLRNQQEVIVQVKVASREEAERLVVRTSLTGEDPDEINKVLGIKLSSLTAEIRQLHGLDEDVSGVVVLDVDESSMAFEKDIRAGDVILQVDYRAVGTVRDVVDGVEEVRAAGRKSVLLLVERDRQQVFVALSVDG